MHTQTDYHRRQADDCAARAQIHGERLAKREAKAWRALAKAANHASVVVALNAHDKGWEAYDEAQNEVARLSSVAMACNAQALRVLEPYSHVYLGRWDRVDSRTPHYR